MPCPKLEVPGIVRFCDSEIAITERYFHRVENRARLFDVKSKILI